jgi:hypothetical protein
MPPLTAKELEPDNDSQQDISFAGNPKQSPQEALRIKNSTSQSQPRMTRSSKAAAKTKVHRRAAVKGSLEEAAVNRPGRQRVSNG